LKGLFRLGNPALGKIHSSAHSSYTKILTLDITTFKGVHKGFWD